MEKFFPLQKQPNLEHLYNIFNRNLISGGSAKGMHMSKAKCFSLHANARVAWDLVMAGDWEGITEWLGNGTGIEGKFAYYVIQKRESGKTRQVVNTCMK